MPAMLQLRIRACHVRGSFVCEDNVAPAVSTRHRMAEPAPFDYGRLVASAVDVPPREARRSDERTAGGAALHRRAPPERTVRAASATTWASSCRAASTTRWSARCSSSGWPTPSARPCRRSRAQRHLSARARGDPRVLRAASAPCWWWRRASPSSSSRRSLRSCGAHGVADAAPRQGSAADGRRVHGGGDRARPRRVLRAPRAGVAARRRAARGSRRRRAARRGGAAQLAAPLPARPPQFCIGCPERPVFAALKLAQQDIGRRAHRRRHRLPFVRDVRAVLDRATRSWATA